MHRTQFCSQVMETGPPPPKCGQRVSQTAIFLKELCKASQSISVRRRLVASWDQREEEEGPLG